ncbi:MAG: leucine-rich repeat domain-containing protein [Promethearchaeota archaeon]
MAKVKIEIQGRKRTFKKGALNLSKLSLKAIPVREIPLDIQRTMIELDLSHNDIIEIENLDSFTSLETLKLDNNAIVDVRNLEPLKSLKSLNLGHNHISKIKNLDCLPLLDSLNLFGNNISKIEGLDSLVNLTSLNLGDNNIQEIEGLGSLLELEFLSLEDNPLREVKGLENLCNLRWLFLDDKYISRRLIDDLGGFAEKGEGPGIKGFTLVKKPQEFVNYCKNLVRILNREMQTADGHPVTAEKGKKNLGYK